MLVVTIQNFSGSTRTELVVEAGDALQQLTKQVESRDGKVLSVRKETLPEICDRNARMEQGHKDLKKAFRKLAISLDKAGMKDYADVFNYMSKGR